MSLQHKLKHEVQAVGLAMLYFGGWIGALLLLKQLVLAEYQIAFQDWSLALIGALILSEVVLILEHVPLGACIPTQPAWVDLVLRTTLYAFGVEVVPGAKIQARDASIPNRAEHDNKPGKAG